MSLISAHVLDAALGRPAAGVGVALISAEGSRIAAAVTDDDGRVGELGPEQLAAGVYRIDFDTGAYFAGLEQATLYPTVQVHIRVADGESHYHVPLLLSPFAYSTYRGS